jgi:predicted PurR-regulated permease PerM
MTPLEQRREAIAKNANQTRIALQALLFIAVVGALYFARDFLLPVTLAAFVALTLRPAVRYLQKFYVPPWLEATIFVIVLLAIGALLLYLLSAPCACVGVTQSLL